jgi:hypothetical protein
MADDKNTPKDDKTTADDKYKGTGRFVSMVGRGYLENVGGTIGGALVGGIAGATVLKKGTEKLLNKVVNEFEEGMTFRGAIDKFSEHRIKQEAAKSIKLTEAEMNAIKEEGVKFAELAPKYVGGIGFGIVAAVTLGTILGLHGLYKGYKSSSDGKKQYDALKADADAYKAKAALTDMMAGDRTPG